MISLFIFNTNNLIVAKITAGFLPLNVNIGKVLKSLMLV